jgi:hypothetical protein
MNLATMRLNVRRDLKDEDASLYRWTDDEIDRAIDKALSDFSVYCPSPQKSTVATVNASYDIDISALTNRLSVEGVEFPTGNTPKSLVTYSIYQDTLTMTKQGTGANCYIYWSKMHTLDGSSSTIPAQFEKLVEMGAGAYAALAWSQFSVNRANTGGENVDRDYLYWAKGRMDEFRAGCKKAKRNLISSQMEVM